jgi:nicotinate-nucleotide adenylyltransferase
MGSDNIEMLSKWERAKDIIKNYTIYVYPRKKIIKKIVNKNIIYLEAPIYTISSSKIRSNLNNKELIKKKLNPLVLDYLTNKIN